MATIAGGRRRFTAGEADVHHGLSGTGSPAPGRRYRGSGPLDGDIALSAPTSPHVHERLGTITYWRPSGLR